MQGDAEVSPAVVIVDDDIIQLRGMTHYLDEQGVEVVDALSPDEALGYDWASCRASVALLDAHDARPRDGDHFFAVNVCRNLRGQRPLGATRLPGAPAGLPRPPLPGTARELDRAPLAVLVLSTYAKNVVLHNRLWWAGADGVLQRQSYLDPALLLPLLHTPWMLEFRATDDPGQPESAAHLRNLGLDPAADLSVLVDRVAASWGEDDAWMAWGTDQPTSSSDSVAYRRWNQERDAIEALGVKIPGWRGVKPTDGTYRKRIQLDDFRYLLDLMTGAGPDAQDTDPLLVPRSGKVLRRLVAQRRARRRSPPG